MSAPSRKPKLTREQQLCQDIASFCHDPLGYVLYAFPWGIKGGPLEAYDGPRRWQRQFLKRLGDRLKETAGRDRYEVIREALASGHGVGKSALVGMICNWAMSTFENCRGVVTANTETQLRTKTWPEVGKWHSMAINRHWFTLTATALMHADERHAKNWRVDCVTWSETNTEAFAGLHNMGSRLLLIFDEASSIPAKVWEVAEGALTDAKTEIIWCVYGNPTRPIGRFKDCFGRLKHRWNGDKIDARTVEGTNTAQHEQWIHDYGIDSDFVKVRVLGQFPGNDPRQFIAFQWIEDALNREFDMATGDGSIPKHRVIVDVADGGDDFTVVTLLRRFQSMDCFVKQQQFSFPGAFSPIMAADAGEAMWKEFRLSVDRGDDMVVDSLGVGAGTAGELSRRGYPVIRYIGGAASDAPSRWRNRRTQSYMVLRDKMRDGRVMIAKDFVRDSVEFDELTEQLASIRTRPTDRLEDLETKEAMKDRGVKSPDRADTLAMGYCTQAPLTITENHDTTASAKAERLPEFRVQKSTLWDGLDLS